MEVVITPSADEVAELAAACDRDDLAVFGLGVEVRLLGIWGEGHTGFDEPGLSLSSRTRTKTGWQHL